MSAVARDGRLAYATFSHQTDLYSMRIDGGLEKRLTSHMHENFAPRFSPDGKMVVYHSTRTGNHDIWLIDMEAEAEAERQLTNHPGYDMLPDWSPDGHEIVFVSNRKGGFHLWVMNIEGGAPRRITEQPVHVSSLASFCSVDGAPWWSPDGSVIGYLAPSDHGIALWTVNPDGSDAQPRLSGVRRFSWYRDGRHVIYSPVAVRESGMPEMRVADLETGKEATLHTGPHVEIAVAGDGRAITYGHSFSHWNQNLFMLPLAPPATPGELPRAAGEPQQLTRGGGMWHVHNGGWSPDGEALIYTRDTDSGDIYVIENYR
jgi:Tol biopolymer transport system component